jgi:SAM-dependent methyltransferase
LAKAKTNFVLRHEAVDIADGAIEKAVRAAQQDGLGHIQYRVADLNRIILLPNSYDIIFGISSIHHVSALEHLFHQVYQALKPGGYFFMDEYVGASQYQWPDRQLHYINEALRMLPAKFRLSISKPGEEKPFVWRPTVQEMNDGDPSEAVRSADILPLLKQVFGEVEFRGYGGSLLHMLLEDIAGNFREDDPEHLAWLQRLFDFEDELIATGKIPHDFAVLIVRKPTGIQKVMKFIRSFR